MRKLGLEIVGFAATAVMASCWLVAGVLLLAISCAKLHAPALLGSSLMLSYGRLQPAGWNAVVFGFCVPVAYAVLAWISSSYAQKRLRLTPVQLGLTAVWNVALGLGIIGILSGDGTGVEYLELPTYCTRILLAVVTIQGALLVMGFWHTNGTPKNASEMFWFGGVVLIPWIYGSALLSSVYFPMRGVLQAIGEAWFVQGLLVVWGGFIGLAVLYWFLNGEVGGSVMDTPIARLVFWTLGLFGGLAAFGRLYGGPFPAWMMAVGTGAGLPCVLPLCAMLCSFLRSIRKQHLPDKPHPLKFKKLLLVAFGFYVVGVALSALGSLPLIARIVQFTLFRHAADMCILLGFLVPVLAEALDEITTVLGKADRSKPRLRLGWPTFTLLGTAIVIAGFAVGGIVQGAAWNYTALSPAEVVRRTSGLIKVATVGWCFVLAGIALFAASLLDRTIRILKTVLRFEIGLAFESLTSRKGANV